VAFRPGGIFRYGILSGGILSVTFFPVAFCPVALCPGFLCGIARFNACDSMRVSCHYLLPPSSSLLAIKHEKVVWKLILPALTPCAHYAGEKGDTGHTGVTGVQGRRQIVRTKRQAPGCPGPKGIFSFVFVTKIDCEICLKV